VFNLKKFQFDLQWKGQLSEYITALSWSKNGNLAVASANGEVSLWLPKVPQLFSLCSPQQPIYCLAFSHDGQLLAAGGEDGKIRIWQLPQLELLHSLDWSDRPIEHLAWHPFKHQLAFNLGRYVQIWDGEEEDAIASLGFANSTVLDLAWYPKGEMLAVAGNGGVKVWDLNHWQDDPILLDMASAATKISWSPEGEYLAASGIDQTVFIWPWSSLLPWQLSGFSGKIRNLSWSPIASTIAPILAVSSGGEIVLWEKHKQNQTTWKAKNLPLSEQLIQTIEFQPQTLILAAGSNDGNLYLVPKNGKLLEKLAGVKGGFSCVGWNLSGEQLAGGTEEGEIMIWKKSLRGQGFGN
jgi:WD40 repeat protein